MITCWRIGHNFGYKLADVCDKCLLRLRRYDDTIFLEMWIFLNICILFSFMANVCTIRIYVSCGLCVCVCIAYFVYISEPSIIFLILCSEVISNYGSFNTKRLLFLYLVIDIQ